MLRLGTCTWCAADSSLVVAQVVPIGHPRAGVVHTAAAVARMRLVVHTREAPQGLWARDQRARVRDLLDALVEGWEVETTRRAWGGLVAAGAWGHRIYLPGER